MPQQPRPRFQRGDIVKYMRPSRWHGWIFYIEDVLPGRVYNIYNDAWRFRIRHVPESVLLAPEDED